MSVSLVQSFGRENEGEFNQESEEEFGQDDLPCTVCSTDKLWDAFWAVEGGMSIREAARKYDEKQKNGCVFKIVWSLYTLLRLVFHGLSNGVLQWLISSEVLKLWIISLINRNNYEIN